MAYHANAIKERDMGDPRHVLKDLSDQLTSMFIICQQFNPTNVTMITV
jgi:hypothetical protein